VAAPVPRRARGVLGRGGAFWADPSAGLRTLLDAGATPAWRYHDVEVVRSPGGLLVCCTRGAAGRLFRDADAVLDQVAIDVPRLWWDAECAFWQGVTGRAPVESRRPEFVNLVDPDAAGAARVLLHRLDEPDGPVRAHPDLAVRDRGDETLRHRALGAEVVAVHERWTVLRAPGGHIYCLTDRDPATGW
jgi:Glyoxalase-like domain